MTVGVLCVDGIAVAVAKCESLKKEDGYRHILLTLITIDPSVSLHLIAIPPNSCS
jgi:hypothetical protein